MIETDANLLCIDTQEPVRIGLDEFYIRGWFLPAKASPRLEILHFRANGVPSLIEYGLRRDDVAEYYSDPRARYCGFVARFLAASDTVDLRIDLARENEETIEVYCKTFSLDRDLVQMPRYLRWICNQELQRKQESSGAHVGRTSPMFSIVCEPPIGRPNLRRSCISSLLRQQHDNFELLLFDSSVDQWTNELAKVDKRIRFCRPLHSHSPNGCLNDALAQSRGEFLLNLPATDELHPSALLELSQILNPGSAFDVIYSDEDSVTIYGERSKPIFKPAFDMEMLYQENYLGGLVAFRRSELLGAGGFVETDPGLRCWEAVFRLSGRRQLNVAHIAKVLYHRRSGVLSDPTPSDFSFRAKLRFVRDHLPATPTAARTDLQDTSGHVRVRYKAPERGSTAIFLRDVDGPLQQAILLPDATRFGVSFYSVAGISVRRGDSSELDPAYKERVVRPRVITLADVPEEVLVFINRPLEGINHFFLEELASQAARADVGLVTGLSVDYKGRILHSGLMASTSSRLVDPFSGRMFSDVFDWTYFRSVREVEGISDHFFALKRELLMRSGGLSAVRADKMDQLISKILTYTKALQLRALVTPFAIASFACTEATYLSPVSADSRHSRPVNPNLLSFI